MGNDASCREMSEGATRIMMFDRMIHTLTDARYFLVDDYLVESITKPANDPNAREVYYRLMSRFMTNQMKYTLDSLLSKLERPLLLLWGDLDPWVGPAKAVRIKEFYPKTTVVNLQAGHCPHDEVPEQANNAMLGWLSSLDFESNLKTLELAN